MLRICRNCKHQVIYNRGEIYDQEDHYKCSYWNADIGAIVRTYGCEKFEKKVENDNLHDNNAARQDPEARNKGIHQE